MNKKPFYKKASVTNSKNWETFEITKNLDFYREGISINQKKIMILSVEIVNETVCTVKMITFL